MALTFLSLVAVQAYKVISSADRFSRDASISVALEDQARMVLDRVLYSIMSTSRESLIPDADSPLHSSELSYQVNLGIENGEVVWSDPESIRLEGGDTQVVWHEDLFGLDDRRVVWSNLVRPFLEGEIPNGVDDNGNGLVDEKGMSFVIEGNHVTVRLTLERTNDAGETFTVDVWAVATCRNLAGGGG